MRVASAETVAEQLQEIASERDVPFVSSDERLNAILLRVRPGETERIRALVDRLDRPAHGAARHPGGEAALCRPGGARRAARRAARATRAGPRRPAPRAARGCAASPFEVAADVPTHSLVLRGPPETIDAVLDVVCELDRVPASVRVEITVASLDLDDRLDPRHRLPASAHQPERSRRPDRGGPRRIRAAAGSARSIRRRASSCRSSPRSRRTRCCPDRRSAHGRGRSLLPMPRESGSITMNGAHGAHRTC